MGGTGGRRAMADQVSLHEKDRNRLQQTSIQKEGTAEDLGT